MKLLREIVCKLSLVGGVFAVNATPSIIPQPLEFKDTPVEFTLNTTTQVVYNELGADTAAFSAKVLRKPTGFAFDIVKGQRSSSNAIVFLKSEDKSLGKEGYTLSVKDDRVEISAITETGLFYGLQSLRQMLPVEIYSKEVVSNTAWIVDGAEIKDIPQFAWRGMMIDVGRYFMPKEFLKKFINSMSINKQNSFHIHLTDDQGWRVEIKKYPKLTEVGAWRKETKSASKNKWTDKDTVVGEGGAATKMNSYDGTPHGGFYTQEELKELVRYAAERHVVIVPEIDMPGHMQAAIASYPELGCRPDIPTEVKCEWGITPFAST